MKARLLAVVFLAVLVFSGCENLMLPKDIHVVSVSNSGMKIINVVYNKVISDKALTETTTYIPKNNGNSPIPVQSATLLADGKTVQLFLSAGMYNDSVMDSVDVQSQTIEFLMSDSSVPTVLAVQAFGSEAVQVTFSEATQGVDKNAFRLDDMSSLIASVNYPYAGDYTKALINLSDSTLGTHTLTIGVSGLISDYNVTTSGTPNTYILQPAGYVVTFPTNTSLGVSH